MKRMILTGSVGGHFMQRTVLVMVANYARTQINATEESMSKIIISPIMDEETMMEMAGNVGLVKFFAQYMFGDNPSLSS